MSNDVNDSVLWVRQLVSGDEQVMQQFWQEYAPCLERLAHSRMTPALQRRVGAEDVVQSVCRTFLRRAQLGEFKLEASESLWRLLCAITLTKVRQHARFHFRQKRGLDREFSVGSDASDTSAGRPEPAARESVSPADALAFADQMSFLLGKLNDEERKIVEGKLEGQTHEQIAAQLQCSGRTVRRLLERIEQRWSRELRESLGSEFSGGSLRVRITDGAGGSSRLVIGGDFSVDADDNVLQGTTTIGKRCDNGTAVNELFVQFNSNATKAVVRQLIGAITLMTVNEPGGPRKVVVGFTVTDGEGRASREVVKSVNVK
jgi:RNA polymerase sigma factor (sigma-70 family)